MYLGTILKNAFLELQVLDSTGHSSDTVIQLVKGPDLYSLFLLLN